MKREAIVFLQNAWKRSPIHPWIAETREDCDWGRDTPAWYRDEVDWPRASWLWATSLCRTGKRLRLMYPDLFNSSRGGGVWLDNTTPKCGIGNSGIELPPDPGYIQRVLDMVQPEYVVACGKSACESVGKLWAGPMLFLPHPAYRVATNQLFFVAGIVARRRENKRVAITQARPPGGVIVTEVP